MRIYDVIEIIQPEANYLCYEPGTYLKSSQTTEHEAFRRRDIFKRHNKNPKIEYKVVPWSDIEDPYRISFYGPGKGIKK